MKAEIVVILDRSGSMHSIRGDAIGGFNAFIESQKEVDGEASVTLVTFSTDYKVVFEDVDLNSVEPLNEQTYQPMGGTALYDAIGRTINTVSARQGCPQCAKGKKVIVAILTDGEENSSREFNQSKINEMIKHQKEHHNWEFLFLAANQDAFAAGGAIGIAAGDTWNFAATGQGVRGAYSDMSVATACYRTEVKKTSDDDSPDSYTITSTSEKK